MVVKNKRSFLELGQILQEQGLTQEALGVILGVTKQYINQMVNKPAAIPEFPTLEKLEKALGIEFEETELAQLIYEARKRNHDDYCRFTLENDNNLALSSQI